MDALKARELRELEQKCKFAAQQALSGRAHALKEDILNSKREVLQRLEVEGAQEAMQHLEEIGQRLTAERDAAVQAARCSVRTLLATLIWSHIERTSAAYQNTTLAPRQAVAAAAEPASGGDGDTDAAARQGQSPRAAACPVRPGAFRMDAKSRSHAPGTGRWWWTLGGY